MPSSPLKRKFPWELTRKDNKSNVNENWSKTKFYHTPPWRKLRSAHKKLNPLCVMCLKDGFVVSMYVVDHIVPIIDGGAPLGLTNLQSLCAPCHAKKTRADARFRKASSGGC